MADSFTKQKKCCATLCVCELLSSSIINPHVVVTTPSTLSCGDNSPHLTSIFCLIVDCLLATLSPPRVVWECDGGSVRLAGFSWQIGRPTGAGWLFHDGFSHGYVAMWLCERRESYLAGWCHQPGHDIIQIFNISNHWNTLWQVTHGGASTLCWLKLIHKCGGSTNGGASIIMCWCASEHGAYFPQVWLWWRGEKARVVVLKLTRIGAY